MKNKIKDKKNHDYDLGEFFFKIEIFLAILFFIGAISFLVET
jgi:hypothetical protein